MPDRLNTSDANRGLLGRDIDEVQRIFHCAKSGVLRLVAGQGFAFSRRVPVCLSRHGELLVLIRDDRPHAHLVLANVQVCLVLNCAATALSIECPGQLRLVDPGDEASMDRAYRYHGGSILNTAKGRLRLYHLELAGSIRLLRPNQEPQSMAHRMERNPGIVPREETALLHLANTPEVPIRRWLAAGLGKPSSHLTVVGIDTHGLDVRMADGDFHRIRFPEAQTCSADIRRWLWSEPDPKQAVSL